MNTQEDLLQERVALRQSRLETLHPVYWADDGPRRTLSLVLLVRYLTPSVSTHGTDVCTIVASEGENIQRPP